jgi:sigma-E factor negative regulatory protein RseA
MAPLPSTVVAAARAEAAAVVPLVAGAPGTGRRSASRRFAPAALAAGVVVVAGVVGVMRVSSGGGGESAQMAVAPVAPNGLTSTLVSGNPPSAMLRDARLDRYMAAHRKLANGIAVPDRAGYQVEAIYESK